MTASGWGRASKIAATKLSAICLIPVILKLLGKRFSAFGSGSDALASLPGPTAFSTSTATTPSEPTFWRGWRGCKSSSPSTECFESLFRRRGNRHSLSWELMAFIGGNLLYWLLLITHVNIISSILKSNDKTTGIYGTHPQWTTNGYEECKCFESKI